MGTILYTTFQNVAEFWNVATRPEEKNGMGLTFEQAEEAVRWIEREFELLTEDQGTYHQWKRLVVRFRVSGRQVHDARLVAQMLEHDIFHLLTANIKDFQRYPFLHLLDPEHWEA